MTTYSKYRFAHLFSLTLSVILLSIAMQVYPNYNQLAWFVGAIYLVNLLGVVAGLFANQYIPRDWTYRTISTALEIPLAYLLFVTGHPVAATLVCIGILSDYI